VRQEARTALLAQTARQYKQVYQFDSYAKSIVSVGQLISKVNCQAVNSSKKTTNEFVFTSMRHVFLCFLEEIEDANKAF
jgi:hypothetical protein